MKDGLGQYDREYAACACFWGTEPGKFVRSLPEHLSGGRVLDLGAGEGKNAVYLASKGFEVVAVDCSEYALRNFRARLKDVDSHVANRIEIAHQDVGTFSPTEKFDAVIAYGLLHCLSSQSRIKEVVAMMQCSTRHEGLNVIVTFTSTLPVPPVQAYLEPTLLAEGQLEALYANWCISACENDVIEETHPTSNIPHRHSLCRVLAVNTRAAREHSNVYLSK